MRLDDQLLLHLLVGDVKHSMYVQQYKCQMSFVKEVGSDQIETATVTTTDFVCSEDYSNMER